MMRSTVLLVGPVAAACTLIALAILEIDLSPLPLPAKVIATVLLGVSAIAMAYHVLKGDEPR